MARGNTSNRGLASADRATRQRVSSLGGRARGKQRSRRRSSDEDIYM